MATQLSLSSASNILKTYFIPNMVQVFNKQTILWDRIERVEKWNAEGKNVTLALHYGRHSQAASARAGSAATLPQASTQKYQNAIVPTAYLYTTIEVEGPIIAAARSSAGSFVRAIKSEMDGATESHAKGMNRQANGDGSGALCKVVSGSGTAYVVDDGAGHKYSYLQQGNATQVDWIGSDNVTVKLANATVTLGAEVSTGLSLTTTSASLSALDYAVLEGTLGLEMSGLRAIISTADPTFSFSQTGLQNIPVASNPWWASQIVGSTSTLQDLRVDLLRRVITKVSRNTPNGIEDIKFILTGPDSQDKYFQLCADARIAVNTMILDGGYEGLEFSGIPIVADPEHLEGYFDFIVPDALAICQFADDDWMDMDGNVLSRVYNKDLYKATLFGYRNIGVKARNALGALVGINV